VQVCELSWSVTGWWANVGHVGVQSVRKQCFTGLAKLKAVLPPDTKKVYNATVLPHLDYCSVVWQVHKRPEEATGEGTELWYVHHTHTATQNTK